MHRKNCFVCSLTRLQSIYLSLHVGSFFSNYFAILISKVVTSKGKAWINNAIEIPDITYFLKKNHQQL